MVILDTNVLIDHLRRPDSKESLLVRAYASFVDERFGISVMTFQELFEGTSTRMQNTRDLIQKTVENFEVLPYVYETAVRAGVIARDASRPIGFVDAAIATTAILNRAKLLTLNLKDFRGIPDLQIAELP